MKPWFLLFGIAMLVSCTVVSPSMNCAGQTIKYDDLPPELILDNFLDFGYFADFTVCSITPNEQLTDYSIKKTERYYWWEHEGVKYQYLIELPYGSTMHNKLSRTHRLVITPPLRKALRLNKYGFLSCTNFSATNSGNDKWSVYVSERTTDFEIVLSSDMRSAREPTSEEVDTFAEAVVDCAIAPPKFVPLEESAGIVIDDLLPCKRSKLVCAAEYEGKCWKYKCPD